MSGLSLLSTNKNSAAFRPGYAPADTLDVAGAAFENIRQNFNFDSEVRLVGDPIHTRNSLIKERFGQSISDLTGTSKKYTNPTTEGRIAQLKEDNDLIDTIIMQGRKEHPARWDGIKTTSEIREEGKNIADAATINAEQTSARNPSQLSSISGQLVGGIAGAFTDPFNIATLPIGAGETKIIGSGAFATAKAITLAAAKEGAIQSAVQAASIPQVAHWQNTVGHKYGLSEAATDIGIGFAGGAAFRAGIEGFMPAVRGVYNGANHVSAYALDKIAEHGSALPQTVKDSLKYMSRTAYVDDAAPIEIKSTGELKAHRDAVQKVADDINQYKRPAADIPGISKIITPRNELELEVKSRIVDLNDLITSDKAEFDQSLQPRDRSNRKASDVRIAEIAARLDPAQLGDSRVSNTGSPIVGPDMMVESGNGRVMAIRSAYDAHPDRAAAYRDYLESQGYNTKGIERPVLIRQRMSDLTPDERKNFVIYSNEDVADRLSTTERAMADARLIPQNVIRAYAGGDVGLAKNAKFVRGFLDQAVSSSERNALLTPAGELSQEGAKRINAALLARAYDDANIVQKIMEDPDNDIKTIGRVLMDLSGEWSQMRLDMADGHISDLYDVTTDLMDAVRTIIHARQTNRPISDFTGQSTLFADTELTAETRAILAGLYDENGIRPLGYDKTSDFIRYYVDEVNKTQAGPGLFAEKPLSPFDIMNVYLGRHGKSLADLNSSGRKARPVKATSETSAPRDQVLPSQTSETAPPSSFLRNRAMTPPSNKTGVLNDNIDLPPSITSYHDSNDLSTLSKQAKELKPDLENYLNYILKDVKDASVYGVRLKETDSLGKKLGRGKRPDQVSDYIGGRIVVDTKAALDHVLYNIRKTGDILQIDDFLDGSKAGGYRAVHIQVKSDKGISAEIQIQPSPIRAVQDEAHAIYKKWQNVKKDEMSAEELQEMAKDVAYSEKLFRDAWAKWEAQDAVGPTFDENAYRLREYMDQKTSIPDIKPSERFAANQARFASLLKENPDMLITADDGTTIRLSDYAARMKEDEKIIEAITTCMVA